MAAENHILISCTDSGCSCMVVCAEEPTARTRTHIASVSKSQQGGGVGGGASEAA